MKNWIIQYVYATEKDEQGISILEITAKNEEEAKKIAAEKAVAPEYIFTVHEQSDDQYLGMVKNQANIMLGKGEIIDIEEV